MNNKKYVVYYHMNKINGKRYVGITCQTPQNRWKYGKGYKRSRYFYSAINKYGWENFEHYILAYDISYKEACKMEMELIALWKTQDNRYGYNLSNGGESTTVGLKFNDEQLKRLSDAHKGQHSSPATEFKKGCRQPYIEKAVRCIETGVVYYSVAEAIRQVGCGRHVYDVCNGKRSRCGGYHWEWV